MTKLTTLQIEKKKLKKKGKSILIGKKAFKPQSPEIINEIINKINELTKEVYK